MALKNGPKCPDCNVDLLEIGYTNLPCPHCGSLKREPILIDNVSFQELACLAYARRHTNYWKDKDDLYWLDRLREEMDELEGSLNGEHEDIPEHELLQIVSIGLNFLLKRNTERSGKK